MNSLQVHEMTIIIFTGIIEKFTYCLLNGNASKMILKNHDYLAVKKQLQGSK